MPVCTLLLGAVAWGGPPSQASGATSQGSEARTLVQLASAPLLSHLKEHPQEGDGQQHENPHCVHQFLCGDGHVRMLPVLAECSRDRI